MSDLPAAGVVLKALDQVPDPGGVPADYAPTPLVIVRSGDVVRAYRNLCPHADRPLTLPSGKMLISEARYVVCPFHGASFNITDGACVGGPAAGSALTEVPVLIKDGQVIAA